MTSASDSSASVERSLEEALAVLENLAGLGDKERREAISQVIKNPSPAVRTPALRVGASVLSDDNLTSLLREGTDDMLRNAGLEMLKMRGRRGADLAMSLLGDRDSDVVFQAIAALDHLRDSRALEPLRSLLSHGNMNVVQSAIVAIGRLGNVGAADDLLPFLSRDPWLQIAAIQALGNLHVRRAIPHLEPMMTDSVAGSFAAEAVAQIGGPEAIECVVKRWMEDGSADDDLMSHLAHALEGLSAQAPEVMGLRKALAAKLDSSDAGVKLVAARCLLALGSGDEDLKALHMLAASNTDRANVPVCLGGRKDLIASLVSHEGVMRSWGFLLAARHPSDAPIRSLVAALERSQGHEVLPAIREALFKIRAPELAEAICRFYLKLPLDERALWGPLLRDQRELLRPAIESDDQSKEAKMILSAILGESDDDTVAAILELPQEKRPEVIAQISEETEVLRRLPWLEWLERDPETYGGIAAQMATRSGLDRSMPQVRELLLKNPSVHLIRIVGELEDQESVPVLLELEKKADPSMQPFVLSTLGRLGGAEARVALAKLATEADEATARLAYKSLAQCATAAEEDLFRQAVHNKDWYVRLACVDVLGGTKKSQDIPLLAQLAADPVAVVANRARLLIES